MRPIDDPFARGHPRERWLLGLIAVATVLGGAALLAWAPAADPRPVRWLRVVGGGLCTAAVAVAFTAVDALRGPHRRWPFISEVLAASHRRGDDAPATWGGFLGSLVANLLLGLGAMVFLLDAVWLEGVEQGLVIATALFLLGVVLVPLEDVVPRQARLADFRHPWLAALFYLAALALSAVELSQAGPVGQALACVHIASSAALVALAVLASILEYEPWEALGWPAFGTRILLDISPHSRARWVRYWQWSTTCLVGVALSLGASGW